MDVVSQDFRLTADVTSPDVKNTSPAVLFCLLVLPIITIFLSGAERYSKPKSLSGSHWAKSVRFSILRATTCAASTLWVSSVFVAIFGIWLKYTSTPLTSDSRLFVFTIAPELIASFAVVSVGALIAWAATRLFLRSQSVKISLENSQDFAEYSLKQSQDDFDVETDFDPLAGAINNDGGVKLAENIFSAIFLAFVLALVASAVLNNALDLAFSGLLCLTLCDVMVVCTLFYAGLGIVTQVYKLKPRPLSKLISLRIGGLIVVLPCLVVGLAFADIKLLLNITRLSHDASDVVKAVVPDFYYSKDSLLQSRAAVQSIILLLVCVVFTSAKADTGRDAGFSLEPTEGNYISYAA